MLFFFIEINHALNIFSFLLYFWVFFIPVFGSIFALEKIRHYPNV